MKEERKHLISDKNAVGCRLAIENTYGRRTRPYNRDDKPNVNQLYTYKETFGIDSTAGTSVGWNLSNLSLKRIFHKNSFSGPEIVISLSIIDRSCLPDLFLKVVFNINMNRQLFSLVVLCASRFSCDRCWKSSIDVLFAICYNSVFDCSDRTFSQRRVPAKTFIRWKRISSIGLRKHCIELTV